MPTVINQGIKISDLPSIQNLESGDLLLVAEKNNQNYATKKIDASYINNLRTIAANLGSTGAEVYQGAIGGQTSSLSLRFRRISAGDDITISQTTDNITIAVKDALKLATNAEVWSGTSTTKAISPAGLASKMSSDNAGDYIVKRDYYGNFSANNITASLLGNATSASKLSAKRSIKLIGDVLGSVDTDLSGDVTVTTSLNGIVPPGVPPGTVIMYAANVVPAGYVACNGATYNRTGTYANLFAVIGTTYGAPSSTTFQVPDLRGYFVRGHGTNTDTTASGNFGEKQTAYAGYNKYYTQQDDGDNQANNADKRGEVNYIKVNDVVVADGANANTKQTSKTTNVDTIAGDTRPKNVALLYCIRF